MLDAFEQTTDEAIGLKLVKVLGESSALSSLRATPSSSTWPSMGPRFRPRRVGFTEAQCRRGQAKGTRRPAFDPDLNRRRARGQVVFQSEKAACYTCHAIGYRGGNVGPDLTKVGQVRTERDLLEAIVYPSASSDSQVRTDRVATSDGKVLNGLLRNETSEEILLVTGANQEVRVPRADIEEIRPSTVSVMPAGLDQQLSPKSWPTWLSFSRLADKSGSWKIPGDSLERRNAKDGRSRPCRFLPSSKCRIE